MVALSACQSPEPAGGPLRAEVAGDAVSQLQRINERALRCWIRSGDRAFENLALVPELDTRTSDPRILVVEKGRAQGLPQLVISASDRPASLVTFGPLTQTALSDRINSDVIAWATGRDSCG